MEVLYLAYAVYGFTFAFISLSVQYELVNTFEYDASALAFAWSCISAPWTVKPLYGYISDKAGRRISISIGAFAAAVFLLVLAQSGTNPVFFMMLISLSICFADVASDSIVVTRTKTHGKAVQTNCWSARTFGSMMAPDVLAFATNGWDTATYCVWHVLDRLFFLCLYGRSRNLSFRSQV